MNTATFGISAQKTGKTSRFMRKSRKNGRKVFAAAAMIALLICMCTFASADSSNRNPLAIDMVIVIDNSYTMNDSQGNLNKSDPYGLRFDAAAILIGMCDTTYSRATYFMYADDLYLYSETQSGNVVKVKEEDLSLSNISIPANRNVRLAIINQLAGKKIRSGYGTKKHHNIGKALDAAVKLLQKEDNGNKKIILLLSDGKAQMDNETATEESRQLAIAAKRTAIESNISIYTVLLKEPSGASLMQQLATSENNYKYVATAGDLSNIFNTFYADMIGSDSITRSDAVEQADGSYLLTIQVPNDSIAEINIIIPVADIDSHSLIKPDGIPLDPEVDAALVSNGNYFSSYKIVKPAAGEWKLTYTSSKTKNVAVQYVFSYGVKVSVSSDKATYSKHEPVTIKASYTMEDLPARDKLLYDIPATIRLRKNGSLLGEYPMDKAETEDGYIHTFENLSGYGTGDFEYAIHFEGDGLMRESDPKTITLVNDAPVLTDGTVNGGAFEKTINIPSKPDSYQISSMEWDLSRFVTDINGDVVTFAVKSNDAKVDASIDNTRLEIKTQKNAGTIGKVVVSTTDADGDAGPDLVFDINVTNFEEKYDHYTAVFKDIQGVLKNREYELSLTVKDENGNIVSNDVNLPGQTSVQVTNTANHTKEDIILNRDDSGKWIGTLKTADAETTYEVTGVLAVGQKTIVIQPMTVSVGNTAPRLAQGQKSNLNWNIIINDPQDQASYEIKENSWNLDEIVTDPNGDKLTYKIESRPEGITASINHENILTVNTMLNTSSHGDLVISCMDNDGLAGPTLTFGISVTVFDEKYSDYEAKLAIDSTKKSNEATITLSVYKAGTEGGSVLETEDINLPNEITATVTQGTNEMPITLIRGDDGTWKATINTVDHIAEYSISTVIEVSRDQKIIPETLTFTTTNADPVVKTQPGMKIPSTFNTKPFLLWNNVTLPVELDLDEFFTDSDGDTLKYTTSDPSAAMIKGHLLTVSGDKVTDSITFTITATDNDGASVTSAPITYRINSLQKQGLIIIAIVVAVLILLLVIYQATKPKFPNARFSVSVNGVPFSEGQPLPKGSMAKKAVKLKDYAPTMAQGEYGQEIHTALGYVMVKPAYGKTVAIDATKANGVNVLINGRNERKGKLASNGKFVISKDNKTVQFTLNVTGATTAANKAATGKTPTAQTHTTTTTNRTGSRT